MSKAIKIKDIAIDGGTQQREKINEEIVAEYAEAMRCGAKFTPVTLFFDGVQYWLADGFHRYHASKAAEMLDILADVHEGTKRDARLFSASANGTHGMRLSNADKRRSVLVLLLDKEWSAWSDNQIAKHCHVTHPFVGKLRSEISGEKKEAKVVTVTTPATEAAPVLEVVSELPKKEATEEAAEQTEPEYTEADSLRDQIADLQDMIAVRGAPEAEQESTAKLIAELRAEIKTLTATLDAVTASRDTYMRENTAMREQMKRQRKEIDKLRSMGAVA